MLNLARDAAEKIIASDPNLETYPSLKKELEIRYRRLMGGDILN